MQRAHRIRTRELHTRLGIDHDDAVTDARRALHLDLVDVERKRAVGDHSSEPIEHVEVGALELARAPGERHRLLAGDDSDERVGAPNGDHLYSHAILRPECRRITADDVSRPPASRVQGPFHLVDDGADEILRVIRLPGDRPHLREHHESVAFFTGDRRQQQDIGERQVGEVPPRRDEAFHVHEIAARQRGARHRKILERAHVASPWKR